ncbi:MAG: ParB/RepB/Spo0J family partition protein [Oscillospiraceae bacterium]
MPIKKGGLGKGLEALFVDNSSSENTISMINISEIEPNKDQPRQIFEEAPLAELADSIREHGILQPLLLRQLDNGRYQIVAGERRWRASRMAGISEVPAIIREMSDDTAMEIALIENLQRENLNIIEEALGYKVLSEEHGYTQEEISQKVGKSRPVITNAMRLLKLPTEIISSVKNGEISQGHARALLSFENEEKIKEIAQKIIKNGISVREVERMARAKKPAKSKPDKETFKWGDSFYKEVEIALQNELSKKVHIKQSDNKGVVEIEFYSKEELQELAQLLTRITNQ